MIWQRLCPVGQCRNKFLPTETATAASTGAATEVFTDAKRETEVSLFCLVVGWGRCVHRNPTIFEVVGLRDEAANPTYVLLVGLNPTYHEASNMNVVSEVTGDGTNTVALREEPL